MSGLLIHDAFMCSTRRSPGKVAIRFEGGETTYGDLAADVRRLSGAFVDGMGLQIGSRVGVLLSNRPEYYVAALAISYSGLVVVPVPAGLTGHELSHFVSDSDMRVLVTEEALAERLADDLVVLVAGGLAVHVWERSFEGSTSVVDLLVKGSASTASAVVDEQAPFFFAYTSGTTGVPKAAVVSQRARTALALMHGQEYGCYGVSDSTLIVTPMYHSAGMSRALVPLITGGTVILHRRFDPEHCVRALADAGCTGAFMVPTMFAAIFELSDAVTSLLADRRLTILSNAAALPDHLKRRILDAWSGVRLFEIYGSTEGGTVTSLRPEDQSRKERCVGPPLALTDVRLLGSDGHEVATGEVGELATRSPFVFSGYHGDEEATATAFRDGWVTVGDLARQDDEGYVYIVGRKSEVVISGGVNVYPREVEEVLASHPLVREVAVIGVPDTYWGERVHAVLVMVPGAMVDYEEIRAHCQRSLAPQKVPRSIELRDSLPRTGTGKIAKHLLAAREGEAGDSR